MGPRGYTLIELMVSMLLMAIIVSAVFSVALSTRRAGSKSERRQIAVHAQKAVAAALRNYVTGSKTATIIQGPNTLNGNRWSIHVGGVQEDYNSCSHDASGALVLGTVQSNVWALEPGVHCLICTATTPGLDGGCFLPKELRIAPFNGYIKYTVTGDGQTGTPQVAIEVSWREP